MRRRRSTRSGKGQVLRTAVPRRRWSPHFPSGHLQGRAETSCLRRVVLSGLHRRSGRRRRQEVRRLSHQDRLEVGAELRDFRGLHGGRLQAGEAQRAHLCLKLEPIRVGSAILSIF